MILTGRMCKYAGLKPPDVMIHYLKMATRHLLRNPVFTTIHVVGLTIAIVAVLFILQYTGFEQSYDQFHANKETIYRIAYDRQQHGATANASARNFAGLAGWVKEEFPEVTASTRFWKMPANAGFLITYKDRLFHEYGNTLVADSTFFTVFPTLLLQGNPAKALKNASSLVISERMARKIFGHEDPIGKVIAASEYHDAYEVTGVLRNLPGNSHMEADFIRLFDYGWDEGVDLWEGPWRFTYITLQPQTKTAAFQGKLNAALKKLNDTHPNTKGVTLALQKITDIHLQSHLPDEMKANGNADLVTVLIIIALVIVILAWVNYISIETSRSISRAREVGIRRIIGSGRMEMSIQFVAEYLVISGVAAVLAFGMFPYLLPIFNRYSGMAMDGYVLTFGNIGWVMALVFLLGSLIAGIYPAMLVSKLNPVAILKGTLQAPRGKRKLQGALMVFQFVVSLVLTGFVFVIHHQLDFMRQNDIRMDLERIVAIRNPTAYSGQEQVKDGAGSYRNFHALRNRLMARQEVKEVASSSAIPGMEIGFTYTNLTKRNATDPYDPTRYKVLFVDYGFIPAYGIRLKAGRNYDAARGDDENGNSIILNERAIHALGFTSIEEALDAGISFMLNDTWNRYTIIGVVEDYYHEALKEDIYPTIFCLNGNHGQQVYYSIKLNKGSDPHKAIAALEQDWKSVFPEKPFDYFFMDAWYDQQFKSEVYFARIFGMFAVVALCIACLGIVGMAVFEAGTRLKEISIRKVMGASATHLTALLAKNYFRLILLAAVIALPLTHWLGRQWLEKYPLQVGADPWLYVGPLGIVIILTAAAAVWQILKAIFSNPIDSLRQE